MRLALMLASCAVVAATGCEPDRHHERGGPEGGLDAGADTGTGGGSGAGGAPTGGSAGTGGAGGAGASAGAGGAAGAGASAGKGGVGGAGGGSAGSAEGGNSGAGAAGTSGLDASSDAADASHDGPGDSGGDTGNSRCGSVDQPCCAGSTCSADGCCNGESGLCVPATGSCAASACTFQDCAFCDDLKLLPEFYAPGKQAGRAIGADVDGDGDDDIVLSNFLGKDVSVLSNDGTGHFGAPKAYSFTVTPTDIAAADLDGDGKIDLVVSLQNANAVGVLLNRGDGTFKDPVSYASGTQPGKLFAADFTGDGKRDILVDVSQGASILTNLGAGVFSAPVVISPTLQVVLVQDFDRDGASDFAGVDSASPGLTIYQASKGFSPGYAYVPADRNNAYGALAADFDGDKAVDLFVIDGRARILTNQGDATFIASDAVIDATTRFRIVDVDHDGRADVATATDDTFLRFFRNQGGGTFVNTSTYVFYAPVVFDDFNGDGRSDALGPQTEERAGNRVEGVNLLLSLPDGSYDGSLVLPLAGNGLFGGIAAGDLDGDGHADVISTSGGTLQVQLGTGPGTFSETDAYPVPYLGSRLPNESPEISIADFNGDGKEDVAFGSPASPSGTGRVSILLNAGSGRLGSPVDYSMPPYVFAIRSGDLDGDGDLDLIVGFGNGSLTVLVNRGDGSFDTGQSVQVGFDVRSVATADFNADGKLDVAATGLHLSASKPSYVAMLLNQGNGVLGSPKPVTTGDLNDATLATADVNGDGHADLLVAVMGDPMTANEGTLQVYTSDGDGTFSVPDIYPGPLSPPPLTVGDLNGDGRPELIASSFVLRNLKEGTFAVESFYEDFASLGAVALGDFGRTGRQDVVWTSPYGGIALLLNRSACHE